ncbi:MAG: hypothetical protein AAB421_05175 [Patescibacteria group bacterium]
MSSLARVTGLILAAGIIAGGVLLFATDDPGYHDTATQTVRAIVRMV